MQITEGVYFIPGQDEMIPDSHSYVIGLPSSNDLTLIDPGLMGKGQYKIDAIKNDNIDPSAIKRVIMTHTHLDHIGCLPEILESIPQAELWVHREEAMPLEQGDERAVYGIDMFQQMCQAQYGTKPGLFQFQVDRKLEGGVSLEIGGMTWDVIHIPGHSSGSIALYHSEDGILIPGDTVYADYAIGRFDLHGASGSQLRDSLKSLAEMDVSILLPGHNRIMKQVPEGYIRDTVRQWEPYLS